MIDQQLQTLAAQSRGGDGTQDRLREMVEELPVAVFATDVDGRLTYCNRAATELAGRVELGTHGWLDTWEMFLQDGSALPHDHCALTGVLNGTEPPSGIECRAELPDGTQRWFSPYSMALRNAEGRITAGVHMFIDITARKMAQSESDERFRTMLETSPECIKMVAQDGTILNMNAAGLAMLGAPSLETVRGTCVYDLVAPEDRERYREFNERICNGERGALEFDIVGAGGARRRMETHASPFRRADGNRVQLALTRDVTEHQRADRANRLLAAIVDSSDDAIISKDLNGVITSWNQGAQRLFGYTAEEAIGTPVAALLIPPDRQEEEPNILARLRRGERVDHFETIRKRKDGTLLDISLTISPVKGAHGEIIGASKIARDITEHKRILAVLTASEARFRQLANSMPQIVWTARADGYFDYYNERWYAFTGLPPNRFGDSSWQRILHPEDVELFRNGWYECVHSGEPFHIECRFWDRQQARWRWFMTRALAVRDELGAIVKWFGSSTDIDEQKQVEDELRRANRDLEQFAYSASHDLQEPLRSVKIYSELLTKRYKDNLDAQALDFLGYVQGGATRMEMLVRDLLAYTRITKFDAPVAPADANEVLTSTLADLSGVIAEAGAQVTSGALPSVPMHRAHLQQLFQNLVGNAIKYRSPQWPAKIHVSAEYKTGSWMFSVTDNGIGIDQQYQTKVFGLFKRLHTNEEYSGTGIGLAICQRIVDRYRGRIWVESELGQGSSFRFTVPCEKPSSIKPARILIVEDNTADVFLIREAVDATQFQTDLQIVKDGEQATRFFDEMDSDELAKPPGLVILDLNLPKKHGFEVLAHMRSSQRCADTPVIVLSTSDSAKDRERVASLGVSRYLRKPSEYGDLVKLRDAVKDALAS